MGRPISKVNKVEVAGPLAPAAAHGGLRDGEGRCPTARDRPGAAPSQPREHRHLRSGRPRPAPRPGPTLAGIAPAAAGRAALPSAAGTDGHGPVSDLAGHAADYLTMRRALGFTLKREPVRRDFAPRLIPVQWPRSTHCGPQSARLPVLAAAERADDGVIDGADVGDVIRPRRRGAGRGLVVGVARRRGPRGRGWCSSRSDSGRASHWASR